MSRDTCRSWAAVAPAPPPPHPVRVSVPGSSPASWVGGNHLLSLTVLLSDHQRLPTSHDTGGHEGKKESAQQNAGALGPSSHEFHTPRLVVGCTAVDHTRKSLQLVPVRSHLLSRVLLGGGSLVILLCPHLRPPLRDLR